ncbi:MAG: arylesterase [Gammaproteobacteria bacterium]|nr:arylesterase [Gammaproteobacteria bacterium]
MIARSVVFPDPDGPKMDAKTPSSKERLISFTMVNSPSGLLTFLVTLETSKMVLFIRNLLLWLVILPMMAATANANEPVDKNILILGDSLSAGLGVNYDQTWPSLLQSRINKMGASYRVINASVSGDTTSGGISRLPRLLKKYSPEIFILELGGNDGLRGTPITSIEKNIRMMVELVRGKGSETLIMGVDLPPNYGGKYRSAFNKVFEDVSDDFGLVLIRGSLSQMFLDGMMQADGIHPNVDGHVEIEKVVWESLSNSVD